MSSLSQGSSCTINAQLIFNKRKPNYNFSDLDDLYKVDASYNIGANNYIGLVFRANIDTSEDETNITDFGNGISYDFTENKWVLLKNTLYNKLIVPNGISKSMTFDSDFISTVSSDGQYGDILRSSISINKLKDIPAGKWRELLDKNTNTDFYTNGGTVQYSNAVLDKTDPAFIASQTLDISNPYQLWPCFIVATLDNTQPCCLNDIQFINSSSSVNKVIKSASSDEFDYNMTKDSNTGKTNITINWKKWDNSMSGNVNCKVLYFPV